MQDVEVRSWSEFTEDLRAEWNAIRESQPELGPPFFAPEFMDAVHAARGDVRVAVLSDADGVVGFFPHHLSGRAAKPAGRFLNDAHNVLLRPATRLDWRLLLDACDATAYDFHALVGCESHLPTDSIEGRVRSFAAIMNGDSVAMLGRLKKQRRTMFKQDQKTRKMIRELGPLHFEMDCGDPQVLAQTIDWKRDQYRRTDILDLFLPDWTREMLRQLCDPAHDSSPRDSMRGMVSALYAGDELVAAHIGMVEGDRLHYWFPAYNIDHSIYSPGTALFQTIVEHATSAGIEIIDMGYGEQPYKLKQTDTITEVAYGCVTPSALLRCKRRIARRAKSIVKKAPMKATLKRVLRSIKPDAGIGKLD